MNLHSGSKEEWNWEHEISGFQKEPFFPAAEIKIKNCTVVGTFPGQGIGPGEDGRCFLRCSIMQYIQGKTQISAPLSRAHLSVEIHVNPHAELLQKSSNSRLCLIQMLYV